MTAKEMFEALGYTLEKEHYNDNFTYKNSFAGVEFCIAFDVFREWVEPYVWTRWHTEPFDFDKETLKAVFKQCQELGWLE